jgi:hypothetical protein
VPAPSLPGIPVINILLEVRTQPLVYLPMYSCPSDWYKFILVREQFTIPCWVFSCAAPSLAFYCAIDFVMCRVFMLCAFHSGAFEISLVHALLTYEVLIAAKASGLMPSNWSKWRMSLFRPHARVVFVGDHLLRAWTCFIIAGGRVKHGAARLRNMIWLQEGCTVGKFDSYS